MKIDEIYSVSQISTARTYSRLHNVCLRGFDRFPIYKEANIRIVRVDPHILRPCQLYVRKTDLQTIVDIDVQLKTFGHGVFELNNALEIMYRNGAESYCLLPPVIEEGVDELGRLCWLINDGMHRVYLARLRGLSSIQVVLVTGLPKEYPYYAWPTTWNKVQEVDMTPEYKKNYTLPGTQYKDLFRDFNEQFPNIQKKRSALSLT